MSGSVGDNTARASGVIASAGGGGILQVKSVEKGNTFSTASSTLVAITDLEIAFAPTASDSKLLLSGMITAGGSTQTGIGFDFYNTTDSTQAGNAGTIEGSRIGVVSRSQQNNNSWSLTTQFHTWYAPASTSSKTYQIRGAMNGAATFYLNRTGSDTDNNTIDNSRGLSTFTITEYANSITTLTDAG